MRIQNTSMQFKGAIKVGTPKAGIDKEGFNEPSFTVVTAYGTMQLKPGGEDDFTITLVEVPKQGWHMFTGPEGSAILAQKTGPEKVKRAEQLLESARDLAKSTEWKRQRELSLRAKRAGQLTSKP